MFGLHKPPSAQKLMYITRQREKGLEKLPFPLLSPQQLPPHLVESGALLGVDVGIRLAFLA